MIRGAIFDLGNTLTFRTKKFHEKEAMKEMANMFAKHCKWTEEQTVFLFFFLKKKMGQRNTFSFPSSSKQMNKKTNCKKDKFYQKYYEYYVNVFKLEKDYIGTWTVLDAGSSDEIPIRLELFANETQFFFFFELLEKKKKKAVNHPLRVLNGIGDVIYNVFKSLKEDMSLLTDDILNEATEIMRIPIDRFELGDGVHDTLSYLKKEMNMRMAL
ncbi:hypothetical protein RFI_23808, partial [Reticulomyxa filosa]